MSADKHIRTAQSNQSKCFDDGVGINRNEPLKLYVEGLRDRYSVCMGRSEAGLEYGGMFVRDSDPFCFRLRVDARSNCKEQLHAADALQHWMQAT
jgi:hypothetical protein